jgi:hypothetical protein
MATPESQDQLNRRHYDDDEALRALAAMAMLPQGWAAVLEGTGQDAQEWLGHYVTAVLRVCAHCVCAGCGCAAAAGGRAWAGACAGHTRQAGQVRAPAVA